MCVQLHKEYGIGRNGCPGLNGQPKLERLQFMDEPMKLKIANLGSQHEVH